MTLTPPGEDRAAEWDDGYQALAGHLLAGTRRDDLVRLTDALDRIVSRLREALPSTTG